MLEWEPEKACQLRRGRCCLPACLVISSSGSRAVRRLFLPWHRQHELHRLLCLLVRCSSLLYRKGCRSPLFREVVLV